MTRAIPLSSRTVEDRSLQYYGDEYAKKAKDENQVEALLQKAMQTQTRTTWLGSVGMIITIGILWRNGFPLSDEIAYYTLDFKTALPGVLAGLVAVVSFVVKLITYDRLRVLSPIAGEPGVCTQLLSLASQNPSVTKYLQGVATSGRQLRLFDVAHANVLHQAEHNRRTGQRNEAARASLHNF